MAQNLNISSSRWTLKEIQVFPEFLDLDLVSIQTPSSPAFSHPIRKSIF